ncbi:hypothetical protein KCMC57_64840 (plasmid) [Kitasatospora sp. CMC57]|uniref:Uncharacterized protein n=1 Tax=Kitasatospora sp. CMC57 TaxID=3231513 RepID=A0AB33K5P4_9ACTN
MTDTQPTADPDLPDAIVQLFAQRELARDAAVTELLAGLTERERGLVKDAAVMGWIQGMRHHDLQYPGDRQAVNVVVDACISPAFRDRYPTITKRRRKRRTPASAPSTVES